MSEKKIKQYPSAHHKRKNNLNWNSDVQHGPRANYLPPTWRNKINKYEHHYFVG